MASTRDSTSQALDAISKQLEAIIAKMNDQSAHVDTRLEAISKQIESLTLSHAVDNDFNVL